MTSIVETDMRAADDDLKHIHGVGPGLERRMQAAGLRTFADLAALTPAELAARVPLPHGMSPRRIADEDWIGQARALAQSGGLTSEGHPSEPEPSPINLAEPARLRQNFTAELLLSQSGMVRGTRVAHVQSGVQEVWGGWDDHKLTEFVRRCAQIVPPDAQPARELPAVEVPAPASPAVRLAECVVLSDGLLRRVVGGEQPFDLTLALELGESNEHAPLEYVLSVQARRFGGPSVVLAEQSGALRPGEPERIELSELRLARGMYRLDLVVALGAAEMSEPASDRPRALLDGGLLQVY